MTTNPENRIGATTTLVGYTATDARKPGYDKDGSSGVLELPIAINEGYSKNGEFVKQGVTWYTYSAAGDWAQALAGIKKGSKVRIEDAKQEVREYENKDGEKVKAVSLRYGTLTVLEGADQADDDSAPF